MSFLLKGHTHDDIDRLFRQVKEVLNRKGSVTMPDLAQAIMKAHPGSVVEEVRQVKYHVSMTV
jgi:hypothetical protein